MQVKLFEIRDRGTFIPVLAVNLTGGQARPGQQNIREEQYLLKRCGYNLQDANVMMTALGGEQVATCDPHGHRDHRTWIVAHKFVIEQWDELESGEVIDVEYILGETTVKKVSESEAV